MNRTPFQSTHWQLAPFQSLELTLQGIEDVHQCIINILSTLKGSDILRPEFGSDHFQYIDQPEDVAIPNIVREITLALRQWEPRINVEEIEVSGTTPRFDFHIHWWLKEDVSREIYQTNWEQGQ